MTAARGITYQTSPSRANRRGFKSLAAILNKSAAGAIYETAGRKNPWGQPWVGPKGPAGHRYSHSPNKFAGRDFIAAMGGEMKGKEKMEGRALFRAYDENNGKAREAVLAAIKNAANKLNARAKV